MDHHRLQVRCSRAAPRQTDRLVARPLGGQRWQEWIGLCQPVVKILDHARLSIRRCRPRHPQEAHRNGGYTTRGRPAFFLQTPAEMGSDARQALGLRGEALACRELERRGYRIVERRFRTRLGELDIVARDGAVLVFVEVKARRGGAYGTPFDAVTASKRRRIARMAAEFLARRQIGEVACRFDVVAIQMGQGTEPRVEVMRDAFDASCR